MLESFFIYGDLPSSAERGVYQLPLVFLSYVVASFASYTALSLAQQIVSARSAREKNLLHGGGAFAMGAGIWSMHFIGMLSYKMSMVVHYDPFLTLCSMLIAIAVAYGALGIVARKQLSAAQILIGATLMGFGISAMHYTGMAAMKMDGYLLYIPAVFILSVIIAIAASAAALWMAFTLARRRDWYSYLYRVGAGMIMGAAICGMHYTGMAAAIFIPWADCRYDPDQDFYGLALAVAGTTVLILGMALAAGIYRKSQIELQLQSSEARLRAMIDSAMDAVIAMDQQGQITEWNYQAEAIFGWSRQESIGKAMAEMIIPPVYRERHHQGLQRLVTDGTAGPLLNKRIEIEALSRNGRIFPVELVVTAQMLDHTYHFTAFIRDITERKDAERRLMRYTRELERSNHELDDFTHIVSHDLKEPLRGLSNFSTFLLQDYSGRLDDEGRDMLETLPRLARQMEGLLDALLHYSRLGRTEMAIMETDLNQIVESVISMSSIKIGETDAEVKVIKKLPLVTCDHVRIQEVFQNLIGNALKYNDNKGIKIEIDWIDDHPDFPSDTLFLVRDNGIGIDKKDIGSIFQIFHRLHRRDAYGGGTGSGLAIVKKIIDQHGGIIWAESPGKGKGTTFYFTLNHVGKSA